MYLNANLTRILLWGVPGSGRRSLVIAFGKALNEFSLVDPMFDYSLVPVIDFERNKVPAFFHAEMLKNTNALGSSVLFRFKRAFKDPTDTKQVVNSFVHYINIIQDVSIVDDLFQSIDGTRFLFILLDTEKRYNYASVSKEKQRESNDLLELLGIETEEIAEHESNLEDAQYIDEVRRFLEKFVTQAEASQWKLAICITKCDLLGRLEIGRKNRGLVSVQEIFGVDMASLLNQYLPYFANRYDVPVFLTSAYGFIDEEHGNFNPDNRWLQDSERWKPWQVHLPFFWAFESIERDNFHKLSQGDRWWWLFGKQRLSLYQSYPGENEVIERGEQYAE